MSEADRQTTSRWSANQLKSRSAYAVFRDDGRSQRLMFMSQGLTLFLAGVKRFWVRSESTKISRPVREISRRRSVPTFYEKFCVFDGRHLTKICMKPSLKSNLKTNKIFI